MKNIDESDIRPVEGDGPRPPKVGNKTASKRIILITFVLLTIIAAIAFSS